MTGCVLAQTYVDEDRFTRAAADKLQALLPAYDVQVRRPLVLEGLRKDGESTGQINLGRVHDFCERQPEDCAQTMERFTTGAAASIRERDLPIDRSMLRIAVRSFSQVENLQRVSGSVQARPVGGDLVAMVVLNYPRSLRNATVKDAERLGVSWGEPLMQEARRSRMSTVRPLADVLRVPSGRSFGILEGEEYGATRIAFAEDWTDFARKIGGNLVVVAPDPDVVLYADESNVEQVDAMRTFAAMILRKSDRPLSSTLLRWTEGGWQPVEK